MKVEKRSIDFIPESERHGRPRSLFFVWFGANANITTVAAGVLPISLGLNLFWSALSILIGSLIGAIFMASHSAQGPRLGISQMIQSRAQFGVFGAIVPLLFVMLIYLGFFVSNTLLAAQAVSDLSPLSTLALDDFLQFFLNFIFFMSYFLIPWTAINLVDYYALRKGVYRITDIFDPAGIYGRVNWTAIAVFLCTIALEIPFMNTSMYVGPVATSLQGVDLAWALACCALRALITPSCAGAVRC